MKYKYKLRIAFGRLNNTAFLAKAQGITKALTSEPALTRIPDPDPTLYPTRLKITTAYGNFETAFDKAITGGKTEMDERDRTRLIMEQILKDFAPYPEVLAKNANDVTLLDITGYDRYQSHSGPVPAPSVTEGPQLKLKRATISGVIILSISKVPGTGTYETQLCTGDPSVPGNWKTALMTTKCRSIELTGLTPGQLYYIRARAIGSKGPGAWSDVASMMAV